MIININKVKVIVSYLADKIDNLYVTKLLKLFYYIDFISYNQRGSSVTNDIYYKLPYGPVPSLIKNEIDNLVVFTMGNEMKSQLAGSIRIEEDRDSYGKKIKNIDKNYNLRKLSNYELNLLNEIIKTFKMTTAKTLTLKTHREKPYLLTSENAVIDYDLAKELDIKSVLPGLKV